MLLAVMYIPLVRYGVRTTGCTKQGRQYQQHQDQPNQDILDDVLVPGQPWHCDAMLHMLVAPVLPLSAIYIDVYFIICSLWIDQHYYSHTGTFFVVLASALVIIAVQSVLLCRWQLLHRNHCWWWKAFWNGGSFGLHVFLYSFRYFEEMHPDLLHESLGTHRTFYCYMTVVSLLLVCMSGFVGVASVLLFLRHFRSKLYNVPTPVLNQDGDGNKRAGILMVETNHERIL